MIFKFKNKKGFTILESLVAIAVLSLSISGAFSAVFQSLSQAAISKDEVKAFYLAQEAVEIIRNKRDSNQIAKINTGSGNWLDGITSACPFGRICSVSTDASGGFVITDRAASWGENNFPFLNQDTTTFLYNYDAVSASNIATNFKREIQIERIQNDINGNPIEIAITVKISWNKGSFQVKTFLFNWM